MLFQIWCTVSFGFSSDVQHKLCHWWERKSSVSSSGCSADEVNKSSASWRLMVPSRLPPDWIQYVLCSYFTFDYVINQKHFWVSNTILNLHLALVHPWGRLGIWEGQVQSIQKRRPKDVFRVSWGLAETGGLLVWWFAAQQVRKEAVVELWEHKPLTWGEETQRICSRFTIIWSFLWSGGWESYGAPCSQRDQVWR